MPTESEMRSRRDSWPPTQVRFQRPLVAKSNEPRPLLEDIDDDPLTYFLTPAPTFEDSDDDVAAMDFDAGIQIAGMPRDIVRSVSPSSLAGLRRPGTGSDRPSSPESDVTNPFEDDDEDDDNEDYIRYTPYTPRISSLRDLHLDGLGPRPHSPGSSSPRRATGAHLSPASFPGPLPRGRSNARGRLSPTRGLLAARARPTHLWREPSPDVWSIEEETEQEMLSEAGGSDAGEGDERSARGLDAKAAKPKKKVRFVLPVKE
jgi:hypothetical protein